MKILLITASLLAGCSSVHARRITMGAALVSLACDWGQTRSTASTGWRDRFEGNPVMGPAPSTGTVDLYFAASAVAMVGIAQVLPESVRPVLYGAVAAVQVRTINGNLSTTQGMCGINGGPAR